MTSFVKITKAIILYILLFVYIIFYDRTLHAANAKVDCLIVAIADGFERVNREVPSFQIVLDGHPTPVRANRGSANILWPTERLVEGGRPRANTLPAQRSIVGVNHFGRNVGVLVDVPRAREGLEFNRFLADVVTDLATQSGRQLHPEDRVELSDAVVAELRRRYLLSMDVTEQRAQGLGMPSTSSGGMPTVQWQRFQTLLTEAARANPPQQVDFFNRPGEIRTASGLFFFIPVNALKINGEVLPMTPRVLPLAGAPVAPPTAPPIRVLPDPLRRPVGWQDTMHRTLTGLEVDTVWSRAADPTSATVEAVVLRMGTTSMARFHTFEAYRDRVLSEFASRHPLDPPTAQWRLAADFEARLRRYYDYFRLTARGRSSVERPWREGEVVPFDRSAIANAPQFYSEDLRLVNASSGLSLLTIPRRAFEIVAPEVEAAPVVAQAAPQAIPQATPPVPPQASSQAAVPAVRPVPEAAPPTTPDIAAPPTPIAAATSASTPRRPVRRTPRAAVEPASPPEVASPPESVRASPELMPVVESTPVEAPVAAPERLSEEEIARRESGVVRHIPTQPPAEVETGRSSRSVSLPVVESAESLDVGFQNEVGSMLAQLTGVAFGESSPEGIVQALDIARSQPRLLGVLRDPALARANSERRRTMQVLLREVFEAAAVDRARPRPPRPIDTDLIRESLALLRQRFEAVPEAERKPVHRQAQELIRAYEEAIERVLAPPTSGVSDSAEAPLFVPNVSGERTIVMLPRAIDQVNAVRGSRATFEELAHRTQEFINELAANAGPINVPQARRKVKTTYPVPGDLQNVARSIGATGPVWQANLSSRTGSASRIHFVYGYMVDGRYTPDAPPGAPPGGIVIINIDAHHRTGAGTGG